MLITSNSIVEVSSLTVQPALITELPLLDILLIIGSLKTLGVPVGEKKDIFTLKEEILVVLPMLPHIPNYDFIISFYNELKIILN
jgi:hypothetical protein